jgi:branched-chain amino acid transport system permease protein
VLAAMAIPQLLPPARTQLVSLILLYAIVACSLVVLTGWAGHISLGQVAFMGFGAATTGTMITHHGANVFVAVAAGTAVAALAAFIVGIPALRISGPFLAVTTLAFAVTSADLFLVPKHFGWLATTDPLPTFHLLGRIPIGSDEQFFYVALFMLVAVISAVRGLRNAAAGRAIIATHENRLATQSFAIDTTRTNLTAFAISGAIAGLAGSLFVIQQQAYSAGSFNAEQGLVFFTMVVIGGLGSVPGAILGAVYVYGAQYLLPPGYALLATGAGIVLLLMFLPGGLGELVNRARDGLLRHIAVRHGIEVPSLVADRKIAVTPLPIPQSAGQATLVATGPIPKVAHVQV